MISDITDIIFFNGHQNGDIANSRGCVEYITNQLGDRFTYHFLQRKPIGAVVFPPNVNVSYPPQGFPDIHRAHEENLVYFSIENALCLNMWQGCCKYFISHNAVNGYGITQESLRQQLNECIDAIKTRTGHAIPYPSTSLEALPARTTNPHNKELADVFINSVKTKHTAVVLIANGHVESSQTPEFSFGDYLQNLMEERPDVGFIYTAKNFNTHNSNCYFIDDHVPFPNLSAIDYISKDCNVIVSRMSGPGIITMNRDNYLDSSKTLISFTLSPSIAFEGLQTEDNINNQKWGVDQGATLIWSNDISQSNIEQTLKNVI